MPEGPEVKIMVSNLAMLALNKTLKEISVINEDFLKKTKNLDCVPIGQKIVNIESKGKFGYMILKDKSSIGMTFGMTGNIRIEPTEQYLAYRNETRETYMKHCKVKFVVEDDKGISNTFYFNCTRNFAWMWYLTSAELSKKLSTIGPSILSPMALDRELLLTRWKKFSHKSICVALMEQKLISGIGNYIKAEIMYRTGTYPLALVRDLSDDNLWNLYMTARNIANDAFLDGGASLYTYTGLHGDKSKFKLKLQVYDRVEDLLGNKVEKIKTPDNRTTHWVPSIQTIGKPVKIKILAKIKPKIKIRANLPVIP
jgi:DNA-formamidopyrimidine glycosylase